MVARVSSMNPPVRFIAPVRLDSPVARVILVSAFDHSHASHPARCRISGDDSGAESVLAQSLPERGHVPTDGCWKFHVLVSDGLHGILL